MQSASNTPPGTPHGPWLIQRSTTVYQDPWLHVRRDEVIRPDGQPGTHSIVTIKPGVCVIAIQDDVVYLTEEFHYAVGRITLEGVSGGRDHDETPLECAKRELAEELGISANSWLHLGSIDPFTASVLSPTELFVATDLTFHTAAPEGTEVIRRVEMPFNQVMAAINEGRITHAPTCVVLLRYALQILGKPLI